MQPRPTLSTQLFRCTLVAVVYFALGRFGLSMPYKLSVVTLVWLPAGIAVPAVFRWGPVLLWSVFAGQMAVSLAGGQHWLLAAALGATNVVGTAVVVALLRRFSFNPQFRRRRDVITWCFATGLGTMVSPSIAATFLCLAGNLPWTEWGQAWLMWWLGDLVGSLLAGPGLMAVTRAQVARWQPRLVEIAALAGLTLLLGWVAFFTTWPAAFILFHPMLLVVPLQVWAALRFGVIGASSLALGVSLLAAFAMSTGLGTFAGMNPGVAVFSFWSFAGLAALLSLLITALEAERTESETALAKQERELRTLTDNLPDVIMRLDRECRVVFVNKTVEFATGLPAAHFIGKTTVEAGLPVGTIPHWTARLQQVLAAGRVETLEFELAGPAGARRWATQMMPELDEHGAVQSVLIITRDITERHRLEAQLRQSQKLEAVGTLAGGMAHDFNNILTGIFGNTQMAMMDLAADHPVQEWLQRVLQASQRAKDLVNQVLAFSRRQEQQRTSLQLTAIVQEAMQLLRPSLPSSIDISTQLPADLPRVLADPGQLHQVLMNLVTNAAYAIGAGEGRIEIRLDVMDVDAEAVRQRPQLRCGRFVRLAVSDTGCGMDAATLARIFEPFFTTKEPGTGTGLGLAVVHGIVEQHEGCLVVYSEPRKGTTFLVYLPVYEQAPSTTASAAPIPLRRGQGERIMIVDDEELVLQVAAGVLQRLGYRPATFSDPEAALDAFLAGPDNYDLVLTDLTMPKLKGTELAVRMRQVRSALPIVLCTGFTGALASGDAVQLRLYGPLLKPFSVEALARAVAEALAQTASLQAK